MPQVEKTEAIVLRVNPYSRTSQIVTWLSPTHGNLATLIKGACRARSAFLGQLDRFYTCELLFYARERNGLHIARECAPLNARKELRSRWRACACAAYLCDLASRTTTRGGHQTGVYQLLGAALDGLCTEGASLEALLWFELRLAHELGLAPQLARCASCSRPIAGTRREDFAWDRGGVLCSRCTPAHRGAPALRLGPDILAILRRWQQCTSTRAAVAVRCTLNQQAVCREVVGMFLQYYLDLQPEGRDVAIATIRCRW